MTIPTVEEAKEIFKAELNSDIDMAKYRRAIGDSLTNEFLNIALVVTKAEYEKKTTESPQSDWGPLELSFQLDLDTNLHDAIEAIKQMAIKKIAALNPPKRKKFLGIF